MWMRRRFIIADSMSKGFSPSGGKKAQASSAQVAGKALFIETTKAAGKRAPSVRIGCSHKPDFLPLGNEGLGILASLSFLYFVVVEQDTHEVVNLEVASHDGTPN
jgi:hypothetical protein